MTKFSKLEPFDGDRIRMVVETPKGSLVKLEYDEQLGHFTIFARSGARHHLSLRLGFVPGTVGEDGDPIDALAIHDAATYPGVIMTCKALGVVDVEQKGKQNGKKGRISNPRLNAEGSTWQSRHGPFADGLGLRVRDAAADTSEGESMTDRLKEYLVRFLVWLSGVHRDLGDEA